MKSINTLIRDIYETVKQPGWLKAGTDAERDFHLALSRSFNPDERIPGLRLSNMGEQCPSKLWHSVHSPELAEPTQPWAHIKFSYGHILEAYVIAMAKAAGHQVTGEQDELILDGVKGHRDCVIDGCVVDVKSLNSRGFQTVKDGAVAQDIFLRDYLDQLDGYVVSSADDPLVTVKDKGYILAIDKVLGHLYLYEHKIRPASIRERVQHHKDVVSLRTAPRCTCGTVSDGSSGNIKLDTKASYNAFKFACNPKLRTFIYSGGPQYFTKVVKRPTHHGVPLREVDKFGNTVYN